MSWHYSQALVRGYEMKHNGTLFATPTAHPRTHTPRQIHHGAQLANQVGGSLNPPWVEWLMGWPLGWTDLKPLGTDKFRQWLELHGTY